MEDIPYDVGAPDAVQKVDDELKNDLIELKSELEESDMLHGTTRSASSVSVPKDVGHFKRERELFLQRSVQVCEAMPLVVQADQMSKELNAARHSDYTPESLPLLLLQHFTDRMHQLVQLKYMNLLRWKRFLGHTKAIEQLYSEFSQRLSDIMAEYTDCVSRAQRLSAARESYLAGDTNSTMAVRIDDLFIYLRWLVCHFTSVRKFHQYLKMLEWLPVLHKKDLATVNLQDVASNLVRTAQYSPVTQKQVSTSPLRSTNTDSAAGLFGIEIPLHVNDIRDIQPQLTALVTVYGIDADVGSITLSADEMELYGKTIRKFHTIFLRQEHMKTFKTYDSVVGSQQNWGTETAVHALKKEANWTQFITIFAERDPTQENMMAELRFRKNIDLLLQAQSHFTKATDHDKVQEALKDHASSVREPVIIQPISFSSPAVNDNKHQHKTETTVSVWQKIYTNPELYKEQQKNGLDLEDGVSNQTYKAKQNRGSSARRKNSFDYFNAVQMLGLDVDGEQDGTDPASIQGGYMSFLLLRHLYIRDLQRTCLSILNYFRSVERTLTINDVGLSCSESSQVYKKTCAQSHRRNIVDGRASSGGGGIGSHHYVHNTPADYTMNETEFIEFAEVDNHDDYYTVDDDGRVHVQDQRGCYIMYDAAIDDLNSLEQDLLLVATHFIEKDRHKRNTSVIKRPVSGRRVSGKTQTGDGVEVAGSEFNLGGYSHQEVDRFAVLLDIWSNEAAFLQSKKELLDCYMEAYQNVCDRHERRQLAQTIVNIAYQRPRFDFAAEYFVRCYQLECLCLRLQSDLVKNILAIQIADQRHYTEKICRSDQHQSGLPHSVITKQLVSIVSNKAAICDIYMLEFHPSLAIACQISVALKHAYWELHNTCKPESVTSMVILEKKMLEWALNDWTSMPAMGVTYSKQVQKDLFSGVFADDPLFVCEVAQTMSLNVEQQLAKKTQKERQVAMLACIGKVMDAVTVRQRLMDAAWETEILSKVYKRQAMEMEYDECHLYLRSIQFEFAPYKESAGKPPPVFITVVQEDDSLVDRYTPTNMYLAINELDEGHVGKFSFRSRESFLQVCEHSESLSVCLMAQLAHKNALVCAIEQVHICHQSNEFNLTSIRSEKILGGRLDASSSNFLSVQSNNNSSNTSRIPSPTMTNSQLMNNLPRHLYTPEAFVSLQLEKTPSRDLMLNEFVNRKIQSATVLKNPEELEKLKRRLITEFCQRFNQRMSQYSLRAQIIAYYNSIMRLLADFPIVREKYFMIGESNEKKSIDEDTALEADARSFKRRVRAVMSEDGTQVFNIWFLPHHTEMLVSYKRLNDTECHQALSRHLVIAASLHDILQYLCAHSRLGSAQARLGSRANSQLAADWGGIDGIGSELCEIQKQLENLPVKTDPQLVGQLLSLKRDVMFLEFDVAVRHCVCETFLANANVPAFKAVTNCMRFALHNLSNAQRPGVNSTYLNVPEPMVTSDSLATVLYPWRTFISSQGPYPTQFWQWSQIEYNMRLCLSGLKEVDRQVANAEILSISLQMEDVLLSGIIERSTFTNSDDVDGESRRRRLSTSRISIVAVGNKFNPAYPNALSQRHQPIDSYKLLKSFLILWKRLEMLKHYWAKIRLGVAHIDSSSSYTSYCKEYRKEILYPVLQHLARRHGQSELYEGLVSELDPLVVPNGVSEMELKMRQVMKLMERFEIHMINDIRKKIQRELTLALAERSRDENVLPTDLWKRPAIKETFTITRSDIAEHFINQLKSSCVEDAGKITFDTDHLNTCLNALSGSIMAREKLAFESYSTYYEGMLRTNHQLLYQREQEVKQLKDLLKAQQNSAAVEVECQLADASHQLLLEVTALRARLAELQENKAILEKDMRVQIRNEYNTLVQGLFSTVFELNHRLDEIRREVSDGVFDRIAEIRSEATEAMTRLAQRSGASTDADATRSNLLTAQQMRELQHENHRIGVLLMKQQQLSKWRLSCHRVLEQKKISELRRKAEGFKKEKIREEMNFIREKQFLNEQLKAVRSALKASQVECDLVKKELEMELKEKTDQTHVSQQQALSLKKLEEARLDKIKRLHADLEEKNERLQQLSEDQEKMRQLQLAAQDKIRKDAEMVKKQLHHERNLKRDAFQRVDQLQSEISELEVVAQSNTTPQTSFSSIVRSSRVNSAVQNASSSSQRVKSAGYRAPAQYPRCMTAGPNEIASRYQVNESSQKKIQRPKTSIVSLRSRLTEQLLHDLDPPTHHEILMKLSRSSGDV